MRFSFIEREDSGMPRTPEANQRLREAQRAKILESARRIFARKGMEATMRQLIVEGQATGEVAPGDPDQLVAVMSACLDGLTRWALRDPEQFRTYVPDARIVLRLVQPLTAEKKVSEQS
jgi:hypothetical protein